MHIYKIALILKIFLTLPVIGAEKAQLKNLALTFLEQNNQENNLLKIFLQERKNKAQEILKQQSIAISSPSSPHTPRSPIHAQQHTQKPNLEKTTNILNEELLILRSKNSPEQAHQAYCTFLIQMIHTSKTNVPLSDEIDQFRYIELSKKFSEILLELLEILHK